MKNKNSKRNMSFIILIVLSLILLSILIFYFLKGNSENPSLADLHDWLKNKKVYTSRGIFDITSTQIWVGSSNNTITIEGVLYLSNGKIIRFATEIPKVTEFPAFKNLMELLSKNYPHTIFTDRTFTPMWLRITQMILPLALSIILFVFILRILSKSGGVSPFGGKKDNIEQSQSTVKFTDIAGIQEEKQELVEIVDYLTRPEKYNQMGARTPKGVLLEGPPGTGKTLLAKAVAGEAKVPFFSASGSSFEEVFVGMGASRIRDLFKSAKKSAPCIIFIDEIDAVGRKRSGSLNSGAGDQTLNQLLVEMDGFDTNVNVIVMAATNRADVLDPALLRPGRFDRQIQLSLPDIKEREAILRLHARNKNISGKVDFEKIAERTPGFSGAQLENLINEAAIQAVRSGKKVIGITEIDEAIDRVIGGPAKTSRTITERDKQIVSYHEAGHAVIGLKKEYASKVQKVTIIPRGQAGGYTIMTPKEETRFHSKVNLLATITGYLGGRAAEELIFGPDDITTGAHDDLEKATSIARRMVTEFGMSDILGLRQFENPKDDYQPIVTKKFSDSISKKIDEEINHILTSCYKDAKKLLEDNRELLDLISESLRILETITAEQIKYIEDNNALPEEAIKVKKHREELKEKDSRGDIIEAKPSPSKKLDDNLTLSDIDKKDISNNWE